MKFNQNKFLKGLYVILIKRFLESIKDLNTLLMRDATEGVSFDHVEHRVDDFGLEEGRNELLSILHLVQGHEKGLDQFHGSDSVHANLLDHFVRLVGVFTVSGLS